MINSKLKNIKDCNYKIKIKIRLKKYNNNQNQLKKSKRYYINLLTNYQHNIIKNKVLNFKNKFYKN